MNAVDEPLKLIDGQASGLEIQGPYVLGPGDLKSLDEGVGKALGPSVVVPSLLEQRDSSDDHQILGFQLIHPADGETDVRETVALVPSLRFCSVRLCITLGAG